MFQIGMLHVYHELQCLPLGEELLEELLLNGLVQHYLADDRGP